MSWNPLLDGAQRDTALAIVREIAAALHDPPPCSVLVEDQPASAMRITNASLALGYAGMAVSLGYLSLSRRDEPHAAPYAADARRLITDSAAVLARERMRPNLYGGFTGIGWALSRLRAWNIVPAAEQSFAAVDKAVLIHVESPHQPNLPVELIYGASGLLVYALARLPSPDAQRIIERSLDVFEASAEVTDDGITWFVAAELLRSGTLDRAPEGCYNLGVSHGVPGAISVLSEIHRLQLDPPRTRRLLEGAVRWLLAQELPGGNFPSLTGPGVEPKPARVSWCYGSPGIPVALLRAARALERDDWHRAALRLATVAARVPAEESGVIDPPFCHGASGIMHLFNRLYQETGVPLFAEAARYWFDRTIDYRKEGTGVAGFSSRSMPGSDTFPEPGMLYGVAGIAAVMAAAVSDVEPSWDAMFALSDAGTA